MGKAAKTVADRTCSAFADDRLLNRRSELEGIVSGLNALFMCYGYLDYYGETPGSCTIVPAPCSTHIYGSHPGLLRDSI